MKHSVSFSALAQIDLTNLYNYIATHSGALRAENYIGRIERLCRGLAEFPERGKPRSDLMPGLRTIAMDRRLLIAFTATNDAVLILRIFYGGRSLSAPNLPTLH